MIPRPPVTRPPVAHPAVTAVVLALALLVALPAAAYVVVLKDGSTLLAAEPYRIEDGRALIVLENGTTTFIAADEIDREATRVANEKQIGTALVLEDGEVKSLADAPPPEPTRQTLSDLIERGAAQPQGRAEAARRPQRRAERPGVAGGGDDVGPATLQAHPDRELAALLEQPFRAIGLGEVQLHGGSAADRPVLEVITASEAAVFRTLRTAAEVLVRLEPSIAERVAGLDLVMHTPGGERAGRFRLTPELARELTEEGVEVSQFFVEHVRF